LGSALRKKGIALFGVKVLDVAVLSKGRPVLFYGPVSFVASSVIQRTYNRTHTYNTLYYYTTVGTMHNLAYLREDSNSDFLHQLFALPTSNRFRYKSFTTALF